MLMLYTNAASDYFWNYEMSEENIVKIVKDSYEIDTKQEEFEEINGTQIYEFKGLNEGTVTVKLKYQKIDTDEIAEEKIVTLKVDKDLNVVEVKND